MENDDVQLIQRTLSGDDTAFSALMKKYQRSVHALAWRKIGDFHIAEDITQETFLKAYQRLSTLKEPQSFASWLYVITANHCKAWLRKKRTWTQSLEDTSSAQLEKATYSGHIIAENERMTAETQREDEVLFAAAQADGEDVSLPKQQWVQANAPSSSAVMTLFPTPEGEIYIVDGGWDSL